MAAAGSGSVPVVQAILQRGAEVNELMVRTKTHAAHEAAKGGHLDVLKVLSAYGANFDQTDDQGNTPIHLAAKYGHGVCCRFLGQRGEEFDHPLRSIRSFNVYIMTEICYY